MNITINQITNGFIIAISTPKGNMAVYVKDFDGVIEELQKFGEQPSNVTQMSNID